MIAPEAATHEPDVRHPFASSIVSIASRYMKDSWAKKRCTDCTGTGGRACSKCDGKGLVGGEGPAGSRELCRRCIGTGKEECPSCEGAGVVSWTAAHAH